MPSKSSSKSLESWTLAPVKITESGKPPPSTKRWRLEPGRPRSTGLGLVSSPLFRRNASRVQRSPRPVDEAESSELVG